MKPEIEDGMGFSGLAPTRAEKEQDRRDQAERKRIKAIEAERDLYRAALLKMCDPKRCAWRAGDMYQIAEDALHGKVTP